MDDYRKCAKVHVVYVNGKKYLRMDNNQKVEENNLDNLSTFWLLMF